MAKAKQNKDFAAIYQIYTQMKAERERYKPLWQQISEFVGINVDTDYIYNSQSNKSADLDQFVDDPTAAISVNQQADYMLGIMWGTGDKVFDLRPSRYVLELTNEQAVEPYFAFITEQVLYHMNHSEAGFHTALRPYTYDQAAFGTSGIGVFPNRAFKERIEDNALVFRSYGVDNVCCAEGKNGKIDKIAAVYQWSVSRILSEFCSEDGEINEKAVELLPKSIKKAYRSNLVNEEFAIVFMVIPRENYDPRLKGQRGTRYRGCWFMESGEGADFFHEESFADLPIAMARQIKVRGETYGRSSGTMLMSSIRAVNFMVGNGIEIMEKMGDPALGMFGNALFGDSVLDTSPKGLTIFNQMLAGGKSNISPAFPIYDVGDPSGVLKVLVPYLNEKIVTGFKVDALLDFSSAKQMTATESLQRYAIRGKSLSGMLQQQKVEMLEPTVRRSVSILDSMGELGVDAKLEKERAAMLKDKGQTRRVIPDAVTEIKKQGRPWFEIRFNNELEKLTRTEAIQSLVQVLQSIIAVASIYPQIVHAVDWYKYVSDVNNNLDSNNQILIGADKFKAVVEKMAAQQQQILALQAGQAGATMQKDIGAANKSNQEAENARQNGRSA